MQKITTAAQMRAIDAATIKRYRVPGLVLMEHAGRGCAEIARDMLGGCVAGKQVVIVAGKGNNGGDGLVIARWLQSWQARVKVLLLGKKRQLTGDPQTHLAMALALGIEVREVTSVNGLTPLTSCDLIVDAIFGTGITKPVEGLVKEVIKRINRSKALVLAVDVPSGLDPDTGQIWGVCVQADCTATMGLPKVGHLLPPGKIMTGKLAVVDIGIPPAVVKKQNLNISLMTKCDAQHLMPRRPLDAHKGSCGSVAVVAGATGMTGAAALCSLATLRSGAGKTVMGVPDSLSNVMARKLTEVMIKPLPSSAGAMNTQALKGIKGLIDWGDVFLFGPGLSQTPETVRLVRAVCAHLHKPTVLDADALNALAGHLHVLRNAPKGIVITPHVGEFAQLVGKSTDEVLADRINLVREFVKRHQLVVVLKGHPTVICDTNGDIYINSTGNAGMATAGAGDVLSGVIAGLMAQKLKTLPAALLGVYAHGLAGDLAKEKKGEMGMVAGDVLDKIPEALMKI
jgi:NAD(P)H-hydrate epimerase